MRIIVLLTASVFMACSVSCTHSRAVIDYTMSEGIIWPGPPEKPRIKYLWSLQRVRGAEKKGKLLRVLAGDAETGDYADPRDSDLLVNPHGIFVDEKDVLYVTDTGALRVNVIDLNTMDSFVIRKAGEAYFSAPIGVVSGPDGRIYVTDADLAAVAVYNKNGKFLSVFEGGMKRPTGLAINSSEGIVYVADTWGHAVYLYDLDGKRLGSIGRRGEGPGALNYPTHIWVDRNGMLYVSDTLNFRVQVFSKSGEPVTSFGLAGDAFGSFDKLKGIAVDSVGHIYVTDSAQDMIKIFNREGRLLLFFGQKGTRRGNFYLPAGIYIDGKERIFVADSLNGRVQAFQFLGGD